MKKLILSLALLFSGFFVQAQSKTGTIDSEFILAKMPEMEQVESSLQAYNKQLQEDLQVTIKKYEGLVEDYRANSASYTEEERATKESEIIATENEIKNFRQKASVLLQMRRNELTQPLYAKIDTAMKDVVSEQKYTHIFDLGASGNSSIAFAAPDYDITDAVMQKMGLSTQ